MDCTKGCGDTLIIAANAFLGPGGSGVLGVQTFDIEVTDVNGNAGLAFVHFVIDHGPDFGGLTVPLLHGTAVSTEFTVTASQWTDRPPGDSVFSPMSYLWIVREHGCASIDCEILLSEPSWISSLATKLPIGNWTFGVYVTDAIRTEYLMMSDEQVRVDPSTPARRSTAECALANLVSLRQNVVYQSQDSKTEFTVILNAARMLNWCHARRLEDPAGNDARWDAEATSIRELLIAQVRSFWKTGSGKSRSPASALRACDLVAETALVAEQLSQNATSSAALVLSDLVHSIIDIFRAYSASLPPYPSTPGLLDPVSPPDIPQANVLAAKAVGLLSSLLESNRKLSANGRRAELKTGYEQALAVMQLIREVSALSVCNVFSGQTSSFSSANLKISTSFVSNEKLAGFGLVSATDPSLASLCHKAPDLARCCANSGGGCCFDSSCETGWPTPSWVQGPAVLIMPQSPANRDAFAYEVQLVESVGNAFDVTPMLSRNLLYISVRKENSEDTLAPGPPGDRSQERTLRMPLNKEAYDRALVESVNSPEKPGLIPACVVWNEALQGWDNSGIRQDPGLDALHKVCLSNGTAAGSVSAPCFYMLECFTSLSEGVFGVIQAEMDCEGIPLGSSQWDMCDVCKGDNSTCSGCDNKPNTVTDGVAMSKTCSGHGACDGLMCR